MTTYLNMLLHAIATLRDPFILTSHSEVELQKDK